MTRPLLMLLLAVAGCPSAPRPLGPPAPVPELPRAGAVVFFGDSTTWHGVYPEVIAKHARRRHPSRKLRFVNRGARGDTVPSALARLARDVLAERPAMVIVLLGINDGGYDRPNRHLLARYRENMTTLVRRLRGAGVPRIVLVTPTCVRPDNWQRRAYNRMLARMSAALRDLGRELGVAVIDLFSFFHARVTAPSGAPLMADANHPSAEGYRLIGRFLARRLD